MGAALSFQFEFKGRYLYIAARQGGGPWRSAETAPLCRLGFTGDPDRWDFEIFMYSTNGYDEEQDFPTRAESPEDCLAVAADFYLLEYDPMQAGASRDEVTEGADNGFQGEAALLPPLEARCDWAVPEAFRVAAGGAGQVLLSDMDAFLAFIAGRTFDLAPRTLGLRRNELAEVNALMAQPAALSERAVQADAPRVQCCFAAAEALGLLRVASALRRAEGTDAVAGFRSLPEPVRLWALLEAMWQRVRWANLRPRAFGDTDAYQGGRFWLGAELGRRTARLKLDPWTTTQAEILEVFLFPFWRDAGLLLLTHDQRMRRQSYYPKRSTGLSRIEVTELGYVAFAQLSELSPAREHLERTTELLDGRWQGQGFLGQVRGASSWLDYDPELWE